MENCTLTHKYHLLYKEKSTDTHSKGQNILAINPVQAYKAFFRVRGNEQFIFLALLSMEDITVSMIAGNNISASEDIKSAKEINDLSLLPSDIISIPLPLSDIP